jgi:uncharacterized protein
MRNKLLLLPLLALAALTASAASPAAPPKEQKVRKLMELTNTAAAARQVMDAVMTEFEKNPQLPRGFAQKFKENAAKDDLVSLYVPIYVKHMDEKDVEAAITFWSSPAGRRISKAQSMILEESMAAGQKWGQRVAEKTMQEMQPE